jgi:predicted transcriptional regulator
MSERYAYILNTTEKFWNRRRIINKSGKSLHSFVRKNTVGPKNPKLIIFYLKHPVREIRGYGEFVERVIGQVDDMWKTYGTETVFESIEEYMDFMKGRKKATFIRFRNLRELPTPIPFGLLSKIADINRMPRNGKYLQEETANKLVQKTS